MLISASLAEKTTHLALYQGLFFENPPSGPSTKTGGWFVIKILSPFQGDAFFNSPIKGDIHREPCLFPWICDSTRCFDADGKSDQNIYIYIYIFSQLEGPWWWFSSHKIESVKGSPYINKSKLYNPLRRPCSLALLALGGVPLDSHELLILLSSFGSADFCGLKKLAVSEETLGFPIENPTPNLLVFHLLLWLPFLRFLLGQLSIEQPSFSTFSSTGVISWILQNYHRFVLFDSPKMGNLMTPDQARFAWNKGSSFPQLHFGGPKNPCEVAMQFVPEYVVPKP